MKQSCKNCKFGADIELWNYNNVGTGGDWKYPLEGHACTMFKDTEGGKVLWKIGQDEGFCEMWTKRDDIPWEVIVGRD